MDQFQHFGGKSCCSIGLHALNQWNIWFTNVGYKYFLWCNHLLVYSLTYDGRFSLVSVNILGNSSALSLQHSKAPYSQYMFFSGWNEELTENCTILCIDFLWMMAFVPPFFPKVYCKVISDFLKTLFKLKLRTGTTLKQSFSCIFLHMSETPFFTFFFFFHARYIFSSIPVRRAGNN